MLRSPLTTCTSMLLVTVLLGCDDAADSATSPDSTRVSTTAPTALVPTVDPEPPAPDNPRVAGGVTALPGFQVELLYSPGEGEGSWVALCNGPEGTLFAADQYGALFQITPPPVGDYEAEAEIVKHGIEINGAQGLCYLNGELYLMATGEGVVRALDADEDGIYDGKEMLLKVKGGGEHGTHAIVPAPDEQSLYIVSGNMTPIPPLSASRVPQIWQEDQLLKREPDARGHASTVMAPGGWIGEIDLDGSNLTLHSSGYRNAYDIDFNDQGELFTFDSDMEWDQGLPWYRPTRINHAVSGSEFGWRNGSGKWPAYYEDSLASVVDIGPASPTGVFFGYNAAFPTKYQSAFYIMDWTYGIVYAAHLQPDGATYSATFEPFLSGKPFPVTDGVIGADGAMYFTTGGRRIASGLFRVVYFGNKNQAAPTPAPVTALAKLRHQLEELHVADPSAEALDLIWANLGHDDRFIRYAARTALEHQPIDRYAERANKESLPKIRAALGLTLARVAPDQAPAYLASTDPSSLDAERKLMYIRALQVAFARGGEPTPEVRAAIAPRLAAFATSDDRRMVIETIRLKIFLGDDDAIALAIDNMVNGPVPEPPAWAHLAAMNDRYGTVIREMAKYPPPTEQILLAFMLRNVDSGWTIEDRQAYFDWLNRAEGGGGGLSYTGYLEIIRNQAVATLTDAERTALGTAINKPPLTRQPETVQPIGPAVQWTVEQATAAVEGHLTERDFKRGAGLFMAQCAACHRVGIFGEGIGPDLTSVANTYGIGDMMKAIINPSEDVSEQYTMQMIKKSDGNVVMGWIVDADDDTLSIKANVLLEEVTDIPRDQIDTITPVPTSAMPVGTINPLNEEELRDLIAYLMSGGDPESAMFKE